MSGGGSYDDAESGFIAASFAAASAEIHLNLFNSAKRLRRAVYTIDSARKPHLCLRTIFADIFNLIAMNLFRSCYAMIAENLSVSISVFTRLCRAGKSCAQ